EVRDCFLLDPSFVEGLHAAANQSPLLAAWHHTIAEPSVARAWPAASQDGAARSGNSLLALLLRDDPHWRGDLPLATDFFGCLRFPLCDGSIALWSGAAGGVVSQEALTASFSRRQVRLSRRGRPRDELLVMSRREWRRMLIDDDDHLDGRDIAWPRGERSLRF